MHPEITAALVTVRVAELRRARDPRAPGPRARPGPAARLRRRGPYARHRVGWLLVALGLRLVTSPGEARVPGRRVTAG